MYVITAIKIIQIVMTITFNAVITAIMAITFIVAITANVFITATFAITINREKLIDVAAVTVLMELQPLLYGRGNNQRQLQPLKMSL